MTTLNPYISFRTEAAEAMAFYQSVLGGELVSNGFAEFGLSDDLADADKLMHAQLVTAEGMTLMAADTPANMDHQPGDNISVSISGDDVEVLGGYFEGLSAGGTVDQPFVQAPWGDTFGMLTDRFGIHWMVNSLGPKP